MTHSSVHGLRRSVKVTIGLACVIACGVAAGFPQVRHWAKTFVDTPRLRIAAKHSDEPKTVVAVPREIETAGVAGPDNRFALLPAAQIAEALSPVRGTGFIALAPDVQANDIKSPSVALEHASFDASPSGNTPLSPALTIDFANAQQAIALYRKGAVAAGDEFGKTISDPLLRTTLEWVALRFNPHEASPSRLTAFATTHAEWPTLHWFKRRIEEVSIGALHDPAAIESWFGSAKPQTLAGRLTLARAEIAQGDIMAGAIIIRDIWRNDDVNAAEEADILRNFSALIGRDDHKYRADRLLYKEQVQPALRAAALAGPDVKLLALARASVISQAGTAASNAAIAAVPKAFANDPGLIFIRIQKARRANNIREAADLMTQATTDPNLLINGDEWWVERRLIARKLLDIGDPRTAYRVCAAHAAASDASTIEAEFHAGWIALRFLDDPKTAAGHFARAANVAETPISRSRVAYWQGRAAEAAGDKDGAAGFYTSAATQSISFYGQLASSRIGRDTIDLRQPVSIATGDDRNEAVRVVEQLYALGERDIALPLAFEIAKTNTSDAQVAALAAILAKANDARATLIVGKLATQRGMALDETAFPIFGIPGYQPLVNSADRAVVYAIARQESEFDPKSVSSAGAKGLMQLINSTARQTAAKLGVTYDDARLLNDASFNAQIGAAHLGQLLAEQGGSYILTFAAYNAGSQRVKDWIDAYGDPRKPGVDPVDWIERIPFTETRNYVQRVFENLQVYRRRFGETDKLMVDADLALHGKGT